MPEIVDRLATRVSVYCQIAPKINFACHQSAYPVLYELQVENHGDEPLQDVVMTIDSDPQFLRSKSWPIDRIAPRGSISIQHRDIELAGGFLLNLSESISGAVTAHVEKQGRTLAEYTQRVMLLACNEWGGAGYMPELLAAFSVPNDPAVDKILRDTSMVLRRAGKPDGIDGYQSEKRERVWELVSALYAAIANLGLSYAVPPASFEQDGQKIRLPSQILSGQVATCLDTSMLFAAALEQAGLNAFVALPQGHAVTGVWLQPSELSRVVSDDAEMLRKCAQLNELILIETTFVTSSPAPSFSTALQTGLDAVAENKDPTFNSVVSIRQARSHRISPLALKSSHPGEVKQADRPAAELPLEPAPTLPDFDHEIENEAPETPAGRLERWQRKLLDLSARNALLNHRSSKTSLKIICPEPGLLEDKLADGARISIQAIRRSSVNAQDEALHKQRTGETISEEFASESLDKKQVLVDLAEDELAKRAVNIYRKAQTSLQEGGANTLFLALGFLSWKRDDKDERRFRAPLILLPVALERKSVRSGIKIAAHDDEPRFNTTLLEMLRKDFAIDIRGLDGSLPTDQSGIDVEGIWNTVRKAVREAPGFEVVQHVVLGHFSFAKYLMWKDLVDRTDALRNNAVVAHLIDTPREPYVSNIPFVDRKELDKQFKPSDLLLSMPADSSQMAAIATADRGKDFITIGPPGTGKSQTISNLIGHLLGKGKKVLFVSEKTAALDVVYRRLADIGLGRFCLELHSSKARKADVLKQLGNAWDTAQGQSPKAWESTAEQLRQLRDRLNRLVDRLHRPHRNGLTPHYAIGVKVRDAGIAERITLHWPHSDEHDAPMLAAMRETVSHLASQAAAVEVVADSPFQLVASVDWTPQWETALVEHAKAVSSAASTASQSVSELCKAIQIDLPDRSMRRVQAVADLARVLLDSFRQQTAYALESDGIEQIEALEASISRLKAYANAQSALSCAYDPMAWKSLDGEAIAHQWQAADNAWWPKSFFARRAVIKTMRAGGAKGKPDVDQDAPVLVKLRAEGEAIDKLDTQLSQLKAWQAHDTVPETAKALRDLGQRVRATVGALADDPETAMAIRSQIKNLLRENNDLLAPEAVLGRTASNYLDAIERFGSNLRTFEEAAGTSAMTHFTRSQHALDTIRESVDTIARRHAELHNWCAWCKRRSQAIDYGLKPLIDGIEQGRVPVAEIPETFEAAYCAWWSALVIGEDEVLRTSTVEHMATIEKFRTVDSEFQSATAEYIAALISSDLPDPDDSARGAQWGVLTRELQKKSRHKPVRQLMQEIPEVITNLSPCLMMSPLSVAQYLPPEQELFDVVIFDEASQIAVWDAVGSIARGHQAIVVGDPKQMPPTNFFNRSDDDPDGEIDNEGDLESILDEMIGASIPRQTLNLHYRSRRESLIAFSNSRYYDNGLVTFPAPIHPDCGVRLIRPEGHYARGKARHNQGEARAIVNEIVRRLMSSDPTERESSIGVVTFNSDQQALIEDLLDKARSDFPDIEWAFSEECVEAVFVKNLETVQGDERDVILFSITYGPDESGHVTMNFGPLNRQGGERRLNVAMTRARSEMLVFSTLRPDRIDLSRTKAQAVTDLKHFLEFAERGVTALGEAVHGSLGDFESPFEVAVARALRNRGWTIRPQIGVSAYRIDLGVAHPEESGVYLAGIECDGAMYHSSAVARERDKIRQTVLEGLGWTLFRVWSTDWWINPKQALETLDTNLQSHLDADRQRRREAAEKSAQDSSADIETAPEIGAYPEIGPLHTADSNEPSEHANESPKSTSAGEPNQTFAASKKPLTFDSDSDDSPNLYIAAHLAHEAELKANPARFYDTDYQPHLNAMIDHVIDSEGPIHQDVLVRRISHHHGFRRAGRQIRDTILDLAKNRRGQTLEDVGVFFWRKDSLTERLAPARYIGRDEEMRKVEYICAEELRAINASLSTKGDSKALTLALGTGRLTQSARERIDSSLGQA